ncbi:MAG: hypothetical protein LBT65_05510, partial [Synergistaceae bacterium]|nr:hypothetical protein [Synergistaceae bacterium]
LVIAGDLDNESMALGAPVYLQITGGVDTSLIMQAPPKHWDSFTTPDGTSFDADVFAFLSEYSTSFTKDSGETKITSETATTEVRQGGGGSFGLGFASPNKSIPPFLSGGGQAMNDSVKKNTSGNTYTVNITLSAIAATDDQLYFASDNYTIWRYPVLYPESMRTIDIVQDGQTTKGQRFIQFVVPQQGDSAVLAKAGRSLEWYEPLHDNRNLFTYPRDISAIPGFPRGRAVKDPSDPWLDLNGVQIVYSNGNLFGNPDATAMQADIQSQTSKDALETITKTKGGSATFDVGALATGIISGLVEAGTIGLPFKLTSLPIGISAAASFQRDDINTTSSTTTTNASTLQSVMVNWPGVRDMDDSGGWLSVSDRQFTGGIGVYTQDDGTLRVSYSVQQLSNPFSRLWGDKSPYSNYPDPGLLLPYRFNYGGSLNTEDDALRIRGLTFSNDRLDVLPGRTLATKDNVKGHFRIFNYSFVDTQAFTADIFFQPATHDAVGKWSKAPNLSTPESIERIASITVPSIYGRDRDPASDNWRDVVFDWTTPATPGNGFVLVRINYDGNPQQLNADNDRGFVVVGLYNPEDYAVSPESAQNARPMAVVNGRAYYAPQDHDLMIESFEVFDAKGNPLDRNALPHDEEFRIEATVYLSSEDGAAATGIPLVHLNMYLNDERHLVASQQLGYLKTGDRHRFTIIYDPVSHREQTGKLEKLELAATSQMLPEHLEGAPENNTALLYFAGSAPTPNTNTGGGGCDAGGIGMLALLFALALSAGKKRG